MFKVLTNQWTTYQTRKFEIDYLAFQPNATNVGNLLIKNEKVRSAILFAQVKPAVLFAGAGVTAASVYLTTTFGLTSSTISTASFLEANVKDTIGDGYGSAKAAPQRFLDVVPTDKNIIMNHDTFDTIYLQLKLNAAGNINNLTAGRFFLWYTIFQLK